MRYTLSLAQAPLLFLLMAVPPQLLAQPTALGDDFQANSYTTGTQASPLVAMDDSGRFVMVWESYGSPGTDDDPPAILGRLFASDGSEIGDDFQVNTFTTNSQDNAAVAMSSDGAFVVVWKSADELGDGTSDVRAQRYASNGSPLGGQIAVNSYTTSFQFDPDVAMLESGDFVVSWSSGSSDGTDSSLDSVEAQLFASGGSPIGDQFQVNTYTTLSQGSPAVSARPDGGFVIVWVSNGSSGNDTDSRSIQGQIFHAAGAMVGDQFEVNTYTTGWQRVPAVDTADDGSFVVVWNSPGSSGDDTDDRSVLGQRFASNGDPIGGEIQVNSYTTGRQLESEVTSLSGGEFAVTWRSYGSVGDESQSTQAAFFSSDGSAVGEQFLVNSYTTGNQFSASIASDGNRRFLVSWSGVNPAGTDSDFGIQARRFEFIGVEGQVFLDTDFDGIRGDGDAAVENVDVHLYDASDGSLLESTVTDSDGAYLFEDRDGEYFVEFAAPLEYVFTFQDRGSDDTVDSDADGLTGRTGDFFSAQASVFDAGLTNGVGDHVWIDEDGDGLQASGEPNVFGVLVRLFEVGGGEVASDTTDFDGRYAFSDLTPGVYYVEFTPPIGFVFTAANQGGDDAIDSDVFASGESAPFTFQYGDLDLNLDAGLEIDGDEDGVADRIDNCPADANPDQSDQDGDGAGDVCDTSSIGDRIWLDSNMNGLQDGGEAGFEGVTVELFSSSGVSQGTTFSNADGSYNFTGVAAGDYYLAFSEPAGFCYTAKDQGANDSSDSDVDPGTFTTEIFTLVEGANDPTRDAGLVPDASIGNRVWLDDGDGLQAGGEAGMESVTVNLYDNSNTLIGTALTGASGSYAFSPGPGEYYLEFVLPADTAFAPRDQGGDDGVDSDVFAATGTTSVFALAPGQVDASLDAGLEPAVIGNRVWDDENADGRQQPGESGQSGITVRLLDESDTEIARAITDADGVYQFHGVASGTYRIEVVLPSDGVFSSQDIGGDTFEGDLVDSDVDAVTGRSELFEYTAGSANRRWDAGLRILPLFADGFESGDFSVWSTVG